MTISTYYFEYSNQDMNFSYKHCRNKKRRSLNFSPQECRVLLQCVRKEKKHVFCKEATLKAKEFKNAAWSRVSLLNNTITISEYNIK